MHRLEENIGAVSIRLTDEDLNEINRAAASIQLEGDRYPAHLKAMTGR